MQRSYLAVSLDADEVLDFSAGVIDAESDIDARDEAKRLLGAETPFMLWHGARHVLTHRPDGDPIEG